MRPLQTNSLQKQIQVVSILALLLVFGTVAGEAQSGGRAATLQMNLTPSDSRATASSLAPKIVNGVLDWGSPSVGLFLNGSGRCTGTLIGCRTFLTAAHCICGDSLPGDECENRPDLLDPSNKAVFFQHAGVSAVTDVTVHPDYEFGTGSDLAVLRLATPIPGIRPSRINQTGRPAHGSVGAIVGFGITGGNSQEVGLKRAKGIPEALSS